MLWIILSLPFLMWAWLGVTFTILIYVSEKIKEAEKEAFMNNATTEERARIIRYTDLSYEHGNGMPGLLSFFEEKRNILHIDRSEADRLPVFIRNRLEMTEEVFTMVDPSGITALFVPYNHKTQAHN